MNTRILELLKDPELLQENDLQYVEKEVKDYPYIQSIRALYLLGVHRFRQDIYPEELSKTAAYTTDKKILYHLINKNRYEIKAENEAVLEVEKEPYIVENKIDNQAPVDQKIKENIVEKHLHREQVEKIEETPNLHEDLSKTDQIIEEKLLNEEEKYAHLIDFYSVDFPKEDFAQVIEENHVEAKNSTIENIVETAIEKPIESIEVPSRIDFYASPIAAREIVSEEEFQEEEEEEEEEEIFTNEHTITTKPEEEYVWKPMQLESTHNAVEYKSEDLLSPEEENLDIEEAQAERPVLNVSFFTSDLEKIEEISEKKVETIPVIEEPKEELQHHNQKLEESNVSSFINTWQNWLKIDRTKVEKQEDTPEKVIEKKADIIDKFIETSPKISQMKEEVDFVVKEKTDDISHLMTETLAKLYVEQKLYAKAIKAYEILQNKYPEKASEFSKEIIAIKELKPGR